MTAHNAAAAALGAPTVPSVALMLSQSGTESNAVHRYPVKFSGTGSAYFRIWLPGALLTAITLGLYHPWAKAQRLRYIYGHTHVAGQPLAFHGQPVRMLRGHLLAAVLVGVYLLAQRASSAAQTVAALALVALWPALLHGAMHFKLSHASWHGQRFRFTGRLADAYKLVLAPLGILAAVTVLSAILAVMFSAGSVQTAGVIMAIPIAITVYALLPYTWWQVKHFQHNHLALGPLQTEFRVKPLAVGKVFVKTALVALSSLGVAAGLCALMLGLAMSSLPAGSNTPTRDAIQSLRPLMLLFMTSSQLAPLAYFAARMQNLAWSNTGNRWLRFKSHVTFKALLGLTIKHAALMVVTLGLYWPFAQMAWLRVRLTAVTVHTRLRPDRIQAQAAAHQAAPGVTAEAAADLLNLGTGL